MKINQYVPDTKIFDNVNSKKLTEKMNEKDNDLNFSNIIKEKLDKVNDKQVNSEETAQRFVKGEEKSIHNVMLTAEEAKLSLDLAIQIRNKVVEAYQELNRMQI